MAPTVKKNYSILSTVFCSIFFDGFLELLFSPFTENFASAVNKEIKIFLYQAVMIKKSNCQIVTNFFLKKFAK